MNVRPVVSALLMLMGPLVFAFPYYHLLYEFYSNMNVCSLSFQQFLFLRTITRSFIKIDETTFKTRGSDWHATIIPVSRLTQVFCVEVLSQGSHLLQLDQMRSKHNDRVLHELVDFLITSSCRHAVGLELPKQLKTNTSLTDSAAGVLTSCALQPESVLVWTSFFGCAANLIQVCLQLLYTHDSYSPGGSGNESRVHIDVEFLATMSLAVLFAWADPQITSKRPVFPVRKFMGSGKELYSAM